MSNDVREQVEQQLKNYVFNWSDSSDRQRLTEIVLDNIERVFEQSNREASEESVRVCARWRGEWRELDEQEFINAALGKIYPEYGETPELQHPEGREDE